MPDIDVSDVLCDPMFAEQLTVQRRREVVGSNGRTTVSVKTYKPYGVALPQQGDAAQRGPDHQNLARVLEVHAQFRLRGPSTDGTSEFQPDVVIWNGDPYVVVRIFDSSHYGAGFTHAECISQASLDHAPETGDLPQ